MTDRQIHKAYVPKLVSTGFDSKRDIQNAADLIKSVAGAATFATQEIAESINKANEEKMLNAKLSAANIEADQDAKRIDASIKHEERVQTIRNEIGQLRDMTKREEHFNALEQQRQRLGWRADLASKDIDELPGLSASVLGYSDPVAANALDEAIGQLRAAHDFPTVMETIISDRSKAPNEHIDRWLEANSLDHDRPNAAYRAELRKIISPYLRRETMDEVRQAQSARFASVMEQISTDVRLNIRDMTRTEFETMVYQGFDDLRRLQPKLPYEAYRASIAEVMEKALVGPEAEFNPSTVMKKINGWYSREEQGQAGLLPLMARLRQAEERSKRSGTSDDAAAIRQIVNSSRSHAALRTAEVKIAELAREFKATGVGLNDLEAMALRSTIAEKLAKPDISAEISRRINGDPIAMTSEHDAEIDRISREQESIAREAFVREKAGDNPWQEDLIAASQAWDGATWRAGFQVRRFGRVTDGMTDQISSLLNTADMPHLPDEQRFEMFRTGMGLYKSIHDESPTYARQLVDEDRIPIKAQAILNLSMARGTDIGNLIQAYGPIPSERFEMADAILESVNDQSPGAMRTQLEKWEGGSTEYSNSHDVDRYWRSVYRAEVASRAHYGDPSQDPATLLRNAEKIADAKVKEAFNKVSLNGEAYPIPNQELQRYAWNNDEGATLSNISRAWRQHRDRLREETIASSFEPVWDQRKVINGNLVVPVMSAEMGSAESMNVLAPWVIPLDPSMIKMKAIGPAEGHEEAKALFESEEEMVKELYWFVPGIDRLR
jgi:hypothetical protein